MHEVAENDDFEFDPTFELVDLGFDSIELVRLALHLESLTGGILEDTMFETCRTLGDLEALIRQHPVGEGL